MAGAARDLWMQWLVFIALGATIVAGLIKLFSATYISTPLSISILWALYNIIPPSLVSFSVSLAEDACSPAKRSKQGGLPWLPPQPWAVQQMPGCGKPVPGVAVWQSPAVAM